MPHACGDPVFAATLSSPSILAAGLEDTHRVGNGMWAIREAVKPLDGKKGGGVVTARIVKKEKGGRRQFLHD